MKLPYYDKFRCIASRCEITCCQEWKISVDEITKRKWERHNWEDNIDKKDGEDVIKLNKEKKCPFLTGDSLCGIVAEQGMELIPHTCDVFPRQIHAFDDRTEYALVSCCPEVIRLLDREKLEDITAPLFMKVYDDMYALRNRIIRTIAEAKNPSQGILESFYILLDIRDGGKIEDYNEDFFRKLEVAMDEMQGNQIHTLEEVNELFLDIVYHYRKQGIYDNFLKDISERAERISENSEEEKKGRAYEEFRDKIRDFDELFRKYLISELFADGILPDSDLDELIIMLQWFAMEYALIKHSVFLKGQGQGRPVEFSDVKEYMVIISRIMGYNREDIYEYMQECFQRPIWDFGYMALLVGSN